MLNIKFKNLEKSQFALELVTDRLDAIVDKFPDLKGKKIQVTLEMENSPFKKGPDHFDVRLYIATGRYRGISIAKSNPNLYVALAELVEHMLEKLNRFGDRRRVKQRHEARRLLGA